MIRHSAFRFSIPITFILLLWSGILQSQSIVADSIETSGIEDATATSNHFVYGVVMPARRTQLVSHFDGVLKKIIYKPNDKFKKGDVLAELDCSIERAEIEEARLSHQLEKLEYESLKKQNEKGEVIDKQQLETKSLSVELRLAHLNYLREKIKYCKIIAPYDGQITKLFQSQGEGVLAWKELMEIIDSDSIEFHFFLPVAIANKLDIGDQLNVEVNNIQYKASIRYIAIEADAIDHSYKAIAKIEDKKDIPLGVSARSNLRISTDNKRIAQ